MEYILYWDRGIHMKEKRHNITRKTKIIIYGAATVGGQFFSTLTRQGYTVAYFVDRRADEIENYFGIKVINTEEFFSRCKCDDDYVIIISIKNVFEHDDVANLFITKGYYNLIYKSTKLLKGKGEKKDVILGEIFDSLFEKEGFPEENTFLPLSTTISFLPFSDDTVKYFDDDTVQNRVPLAFIFSDKSKDEKAIWADINYMGLLPHLNFFNCLLGSKKYDHKMYLEFCHACAERSGGIKPTKRWEEGVLENRINVGHNMEMEMWSGTDFFDEASPYVELSDAGVFNTCSGKHRVTYLIAKGNFFVTLKMKEEDYYKWVNMEKAYEIYNYLKTYNVRKLEVPIMNPYFYKYPCDNAIFYYNMQKEIIRYIYEFYYCSGHRFNFNDKRVYTCGNLALIMNPVLYNIGFIVLSEDYSNEPDRELKDLIYELYGTKLASTEDKEMVDFVITDNIDEIGHIAYKCSFIISIENYDDSVNCTKHPLKDVLVCGFVNGVRKAAVVYRA